MTLDALDALLDPALLHRVHDVAVLDTDRATVRVAQDRQDLFEGRLAPSRQAVDDEGALEVPDRESVGREVEFGVQAAAARCAGGRGARSGDRARGTC